jgi:hypothetical protein
MTITDMQVAIQTQYVAGHCHGPDRTLPKPLSDYATLRLPTEVANKSLANAGIKALLAVEIDGVTAYFAGVFVGGGHEGRMTYEDKGEVRIVAAAEQFSLFMRADVSVDDKGLVVRVRKNEQPFNLKDLLERANGPIQVLLPIRTDIT